MSAPRSLSRYFALAVLAIVCGAIGSLVLSWLVWKYQYIHARIDLLQTKIIELEAQR